MKNKSTFAGMLLGLLIPVCCGIAQAGSATAVAYNEAGDIVATATWLSTTPPKGGHFKTAEGASDYVVQHLKDKGYKNVHLVEDAEISAYFSVGVGVKPDGKHDIEIEHGGTQVEADQKVYRALNKFEAKGNQQIVRRGFSYGTKSGAPVSSGM
jgi:hypothetical protein